VELSRREVDGKVLVELSGPFPRDPDEIAEGARRFCDALGDRENIILVLHDVWPVTSSDFATFLKWLLGSGMPLGGGLLPPLTHVVCSDKRVARLFEFVDSPFIVYRTKAEAMCPKKSSGCLGLFVLSTAYAIAAGALV
jgi:hypothetical protein